jgi:hypothetical protein
LLRLLLPLPRSMFAVVAVVVVVRQTVSFQFSVVHLL